MGYDVDGRDCPFVIGRRALGRNRIVRLGVRRCSDVGLGVGEEACFVQRSGAGVDTGPIGAGVIEVSSRNIEAAQHC